MEDDFGSQGMRLIPGEAIRSSGLSFNFLLFSQIERINKMREFILLKPITMRKEAMLSFYFDLDSLETLLWGKLENNPKYLKEKKELNLDSVENFKSISTPDLAGVLQFNLVMSKWYKLLSKHLRAFGFYPATQMDFISGVGEYAERPVKKTVTTK